MWKFFPSSPYLLSEALIGHCFTFCTCFWLNPGTPSLSSFPCCTFSLFNSIFHLLLTFVFLIWVFLWLLSSECKFTRGGVFVHFAYWYMHNAWNCVWHIVDAQKTHTHGMKGWIGRTGINRELQVVGSRFTGLCCYSVLSYRRPMR